MKCLRPIVFGAVAILLMLAAGTVGALNNKPFRYSARAWEMERHFNLRAGLSPRDDRLPERVLQPSAGDKSPKFAIEDLIQEYYRIRGWDNGRPSQG